MKHALICIVSTGIARYISRWLNFEPVTTTELRLVARLQPDWAAGAHEWKVVEADDE